MDKRNSNYQQWQITPAKTGAAAVTITHGDVNKAFYSSVGGTITYTLPQAIAGAGPFYFFVNLGPVIVKPQAADILAGLSAGTSLNLPTGASSNLYGFYCLFAGYWTAYLPTGPITALIAPITISALAGQNSLTVNGANGQYAEVIVSPNVASNSFGLEIIAGTNSSDINLICLNAADNAEYIRLAGDGSIRFNGSNVGGVGLGANVLMYGSNAGGGGSVGVLRMLTVSGGTVTAISTEGANLVNAFYNSIAGASNALLMNNSGTDWGTVGNIGSNIWGLGLNATGLAATTQANCPILWGGTTAQPRIGFYGTTPINQNVGYGTPTNISKTSSLPGTTSTLAQVGGTLAALIADLKAYGLIGA